MILKKKRNYEWRVGLFNKLFSSALRRVLGWLSGLFEVIRKKAVMPYFKAEPIICLEDPRIAPKTVKHCTL